MTKITQALFFAYGEKIINLFLCKFSVSGTCPLLYTLSVRPFLRGRIPLQSSDLAVCPVVLYPSAFKNIIFIYVI